MPQHGANPAGLYGRFGVEMPRGVPILDFSTNTNVLAWEGDERYDLPALLSNYPDPDCTALRETIAEHAACDAANVLVTNGSNEAVYLIASHFAGQGASFADPTYGEYRRACDAYGVPEAKEKDAGALHFLCNPCNPTGGYIETDEIEARAATHPERCFVVDEAYIDFLDGEHREIAVHSHPNIVLLRSLTKIFHLCGARIGYVLASSDWIGRLKARQPSWSVNALAQEACLRFLKDRTFAERTRRFYRTETPRFMGKLRAAGLHVRPTRTNFFLVEAADDETTIRELLKAGLVVRHTRNFIGLDGRYIRVATRLPAENDRFAEAARSLRSLYGSHVF